MGGIKKNKLSEHQTKIADSIFTNLQQLQKRSLNQPQSRNTLTVAGFHHFFNRGFSPLNKVLLILT